MANKLEEIINELVEYIDSCKFAPLSQNRIIVNKEEVLAKLEELRERTPDEIRRYQRIVTQRETILANAEEKAKQIEEEARATAQQLINENEVMKQAYAQASELVQSATEEAERITRDAEEKAEALKNGIMGYSNDVMSEMESLLSITLTQYQENSERLIGILRDRLDRVHADQEQLREENESEEEAPAEGDYEFPEGTFYEGIDE